MQKSVLKKAVAQACELIHLAISAILNDKYNSRSA